jgi:hypothetical protein
MIALQHDFRVYQFRNGLKRPVTLHRKVLHALFGGDVRLLDHFRPRFLKSLKTALQGYPHAQIEIKNDCIMMQDPEEREERIERIAVVAGVGNELSECVASCGGISPTPSTKVGATDACC